MFNLKEFTIIKNNYFHVKLISIFMVLIFFGTFGNAEMIEVEKEKVNKQPNLYAVVVGVGKLKTQELNLKYAEADTLLFGRTLERNSKTLFSKVKIIYLNKENKTTKKSILKELNNLQNISKNDLFVFYVTSFAKVIDTNYYMITSNTQSTDDKDIIRDALSRDELVEAFEKIPAENKLLLFDSCYPSVAVDLKYKTKEKLNIASVAASNSKQTALKINVNKHSIFANTVSDAIAGEADFDGDGVVKSSEFLKYVFNTASVEAARYDYKQMPAYYQGGDIFSITSSGSSKPLTIAVIKKSPIIKVHKPEKMNVVEPKKIEKLKNEKIGIRVDKFNFVIDDNSVFIDVKREIKKHFSFTSDEGQYLIVFDFYTNNFVKYSVKNIDIDKISQIKIGYHRDFFRVVLNMKSKTSYDYKVTKDGLLIELKNKKQ